MRTFFYHNRSRVSQTRHNNPSVFPWTCRLQPLLQSLVPQVVAYLSGPVLPIGECPLLWWHEHGAKAFPGLTVLARQALACPGSCAVIERTWSAGKRYC